MAVPLKGFFKPERRGKARRTNRTREHRISVPTCRAEDRRHQLQGAGIPAGRLILSGGKQTGGGPGPPFSWQRPGLRA